MFSSAESAHQNLPISSLVRADVIHLHWIAGFIDYRRFFEGLPKNKPVVFTVHDMNPFTGGCHYAGTCEKFISHCGACPQLGSTYNYDLSYSTFALKAKAYETLHPERVTFVAPSRWMAGQLSKSALAGRFRIELIPNGIDLHAFQPCARDAVRQALGLQKNDKVILFVSDAIDKYRKGGDQVVSAIEAMSSTSDLVLVTVGAGNLRLNGGIRRMHLGRVESDLLLSLIYNAADVCVVPSREDNLPQTAVEALACGCPVVGFSVGGLIDIVEIGRTGFLAEPFDVRHLREGVELLLNRRAERAGISEECRARAERLFSLETQARAYMKLYFSERCAGSDSAVGAKFLSS
jgi:glycosyltransferase involved in cell wall biosynthesis